jgi:hypothetical protein
MNRRLLKLLILFLVLGDLFAFGSRYMVSFDSREAYGDPGALAFLRREREPFRVLVPQAEANFGMANGLETPGGYDTLMLKRYSEYLNYALGRDPAQPELYLNPGGSNKLIDLLNARFLLTGPQGSPGGGAFRRVYGNGKAQVYRNDNALPRAFVVHGARRASGRDAVFRELASPGFDPWTEAVVEEELPGLPAGTPGRGRLPVLVGRTAGGVTLDADLERAGLLVLAESYYPGWRARVDGRETRIYPANYVMRAVLLPAGKHRVEFSYAPASFRTGALISLAALLLALIALAWPRLSRDRAPGAGVRGSGRGRPDES